MLSSPSANSFVGRRGCPCNGGVAGGEGLLLRRRGDDLRRTGLVGHRIDQQLVIVEPGDDRSGDGDAEGGRVVGPDPFDRDRVPLVIALGEGHVDREQREHRVVDRLACLRVGRYGRLTPTSWNPRTFAANDRRWESQGTIARESRVPPEDLGEGAGKVSDGGVGKRLARVLRPRTRRSRRREGQCVGRFTDHGR